MDDTEPALRQISLWISEEFGKIWKKSTPLVIIKVSRCGEQLAVAEMSDAWGGTWDPLAGSLQDGELWHCVNISEGIEITSCFTLGQRGSIWTSLWQQKFCVHIISVRFFRSSNFQYHFVIMIFLLEKSGADRWRLFPHNVVFTCYKNCLICVTVALRMNPLRTPIKLITIS